MRYLLLHTAKVLRDDVTMFRERILNAEGGNVPPDIREKQAILKEIEEALRQKVTNRKSDCEAR